MKAIERKAHTAGIKTGFGVDSGNDEDPEMRPEPISPEKREEVIVHMAAGLLQAYRYFRAQRQISPGAHTSEPRRSAPKVGRNDLCPVWLGEEVRAVLRRGERELSALWMPPRLGVSEPRSAIIGARGFGMKSRLGYKGYVIEARLSELKDVFSAEFSI